MLGESSKPTPPALLPFAPRDVGEWSEDHYHIFEMVELSVGHYKEVDPEEAEAKSTADKIQKAMEEGGDWRSLLGQGDTNNDDEIPFEDMDKIFSDKDAMQALRDGLDKQRSQLRQQEDSQF